MTPDLAQAAASALGARQQLQSWLLEKALPTWVAHGVDWSGGGFFERLTEQGLALDEPRRTRVVARQIYVFSVAQRMGWDGDALTIVQHGLDFLLGKLRQADHTYAASVDVDGRLVNARFDLYEQAFALFALAQAAACVPGRVNELSAHAQALRQTLARNFKHPLVGFQESAPPTAPLKANPHMHLFEAALAWTEVLPQDAAWRALADELAGLALERLIDSGTGALSECFDLDWRAPIDPGQQVVEPGHQFEWCWLLSRWGGLHDHEPALAAARRLLVLGEQHGVCARRGVAVNALDGHLRLTDADAKLWPQTERIKAWCARLERVPSGPGNANASESITCLQGLTRSINALMGYFQHPLPGLWREVCLADGRYATEPCRASSLYHIVCAIETVSRTSRATASVLGGAAW